MYKISDFSKLAKTTIKTLRYYEKEGLITPKFVDTNGYRYYEAEQLTDLAHIVSLRQVGFSIKEIKEIMSGNDFNVLLRAKKEQMEEELSECKWRISKIKYLLGEEQMKYEVIVKELPDYVVYYKEGIVKDFSKIVEFILGSGQECLELNPTIKCVEPDYCYVEYLDGEYKAEDIKIRYSQAVLSAGKENDNIKFKKLDKQKAVCIYHKGGYDKLGDAYAFILKYIAENGYQMASFPRERYIDGIWNKETEDEWLTEIQVPVK